MRTKHTFRLPPDLAGKLADYAARKRVPQTLVVEAGSPRICRPMAPTASKPLSRVALTG